MLVRSFVLCIALCFFFFFNDTATTEIYTLSLHDALPISASGHLFPKAGLMAEGFDADKGFSRVIFSGSHDASIMRSEEHTSELQSQSNLVCRLLLEKKKKKAPNLLNRRCESTSTTPTFHN